MSFFHYILKYFEYRLLLLFLLFVVVVVGSKLGVGRLDDARGWLSKCQTQPRLDPYICRSILWRHLDLIFSSPLFFLSHLQNHVLKLSHVIIY